MSERVIRAITPLFLFCLGVGLEIYAIDAKVQKDTSNVVTGLISAAAALSIGVKDDNKPSN
jgi:hypothetical protein